MFSHLAGGKVNVGLLQELALNELITILEKCDGPIVNKFIKNYFHQFSNLFNY